MAVRTRLHGHGESSSLTARFYPDVFLPRLSFKNYLGGDHVAKRPQLLVPGQQASQARGAQLDIRKHRHAHAHAWRCLAWRGAAVVQCRGCTGPYAKPCTRQLRRSPPARHLLALRRLPGVHLQHAHARQELPDLRRGGTLGDASMMTQRVAGMSQSAPEVQRAAGMYPATDASRGGSLGLSQQHLHTFLPPTLPSPFPRAKPHQLHVKESKKVLRSSPSVHQRGAHP